MIITSDSVECEPLKSSISWSANFAADPLLADARNIDGSMPSFSEESLSQSSSLSDGGLLMIVPSILRNHHLCQVNYSFVILAPPRF